MGAGISVEPPAGLMSARQIIKAILKFGAASEALSQLEEIPNLRYEFIVQLFRDTFDKDLKFLNYFEQSKDPNVIHFFLTQMIRAGHYVLTTNFDTLIERAVGIDQDALKIVITQDDFEKFGNPQKNVENGLFAVYKIHGSLNNIKTRVDTRESIITTLDALVKNKEGKIFSLETFKRDFFTKVCQNRTLVVMGYAGGDDFDIIPTLSQMKGLKRIIWIAHSPKDQMNVEIFRIVPNVGLTSLDTINIQREDEVLYTLSLLGTSEVIKVKAHTSSLVSDLVNSFQLSQESKNRYDAYTWLVNHLPSPDENLKAFFTARLFHTYLYRTEALPWYEKAYGLFENVNDVHGMAQQLASIGMIHLDIGDKAKALEYFRKGYELAESNENHLWMGNNMNNMGLPYRMANKYNESMKCHFKALKIHEDVNEIQGMARDLNNIGIVYNIAGQAKSALDYLEKAIKHFESIGDLDGMRSTFGNLGISYRQLWITSGRSTDLMEKTIEYFQKSYKISELLGNLQGMALQLGNLGVIHRDKKEFNESLEFLIKAYKFFEQLGEPRGMLRQLSNIEVLYEESDIPQTINIEKLINQIEKKYSTKYIKRR
jgi:tetratricopeptide (TPR) repeat protein